MQALIVATSRALIANDAEALERLAAEARVQPSGDLSQIRGAVAVLSAQVDAMAAHITLRARVLASQRHNDGPQWGR